MRLRFILLFLLLSIIVFIGVADAMPAGFENGKNHYINSTSNLYNYPIKIVLCNGTGTDMGGAAFLGGKVAADWDDVRFNQSYNGTDTSTVLSFWYEEGNDTMIDATHGTRTFWVNMSFIFSNNTCGMWIFYNSTGATSAVNGDTTFPFIDDMSGDTSKWVDEEAGITKSNSNGVMTLTFSSGAPSILRNNVAFGANYALVSRLKTAHFNTASYGEI
jgi:hypothetical protein